MIERIWIVVALAVTATRVCAFEVVAVRPAVQHSSSRAQARRLLADVGAPAGMPAPDTQPAAYQPWMQPMPAPAPAPAPDAAEYNLRRATPSPPPSPASMPAPAPSPAEGPRRPRREVTEPPPVPAWVRLGDLESSWRQDREGNLEVVAAFNATAPPAPLDLVMYGDSITQYNLENPEPWEESFGDLNTLPLGMKGSTVESLAWRVVAGGEKPAVAPRVAVLLIGINNVYKDLNPPAPRLEWLVEWLGAVWPDTQLAIMTLLPTTWTDVAPTNRQYAELASRRGLPLIDCGQGMDPEGDLYRDGLHPNAEGHARVAACLRRAVEPFLPPR